MRQVTDNKDLDFKDVSHQLYRVYVFNGSEVTITSPVSLHVSSSGGHRIMDAAGISHYIPPKWIHLYWKNNDESPAFKF